MHQPRNPDIAQASLLEGYGGPWFVPENVEAVIRPAEGYLLFLALLPDEAEAGVLAQYAVQYCKALQLKYSLPPRRLHITLLPLMLFPYGVPIPQLIIDAAKDAATSVARLSAIPVAFDSARSMGKDHYALALCCDPSSQTFITVLQRTLAQALKRRGLGPRAAGGTAHMSLCYHNTSPIGLHPVLDAPSFTARRLALLLSHRGNSHYEPIAEWRLIEQRVKLVGGESRTEYGP